MISKAKTLSIAALLATAASAAAAPILIYDIRVTGVSGGATSTGPKNATVTGAGQVVNLDLVSMVRDGNNITNDDAFFVSAGNLRSVGGLLGNMTLGSLGTHLAAPPLTDVTTGDVDSDTDTDLTGASGFMSMSTGLLPSRTGATVETIASGDNAGTYTVQRLVSFSFTSEAFVGNTSADVTYSLRPSRTADQRVQVDKSEFSAANSTPIRTNAAGESTSSSNGPYDGRIVIGGLTITAQGVVVNPLANLPIDRSNNGANFAAAGQQSVAVGASYDAVITSDVEVNGPAGRPRLGTGAALFGGVASKATQIVAAWRTRTQAEYPGTATNPPFITGTPYAGLASDVLRLNGISAPPGADSRVDGTLETDTFALEMAYNEAELVRIFTGNPNTAYNTEAEIAAAGVAFIGYLSLGANGGHDTGFGVPNDPNADYWIPAIDGNFGVGPNAVMNYQGTYSEFATAMGITGANITNYLGSYGIDTTDNVVWSILNHNSDFAVVPEPASLALLGLGALALRRRR